MTRWPIPQLIPCKIQQHQETISQAQLDEEAAWAKNAQAVEKIHRLAKERDEAWGDTEGSKKAKDLVCSLMRSTLGEFVCSSSKRWVLNVYSLDTANLRSVWLMLENSVVAGTTVGYVNGVGDSHSFGRDCNFWSWDPASIARSIAWRCRFLLRKRNQWTRWSKPQNLMLNFRRQINGMLWS